jgi:hypothetical protein
MDFEKNYDVLIAGAGIAGISAALVTARAGLRTALVEKTVLSGGLATAGLVNIYLPLCDGNGTQVTFGLAEELLLRSILYGPGEIPPYWKQARNAKEKDRYCVSFSPASFMLALDEILGSAGVDLWLDTLICAPIMKDSRVTGVEVENKSGRGILNAYCIVDATGDADIAFRAGSPCINGKNHFTVWSQGASLNIAENAVEQNDGSQLIGHCILQNYNPGIDLPSKNHEYNATNSRSVSAFILEGRRRLLKHYKDIQNSDPEAGRKNNFPMTLPGMVQFRTIRHIIGKISLCDNQHMTRFEDSIGLAADWRKPGSVWEVPYRALLPRHVQGLICAGRCISSEGDAWEVTRVIPIVALTGEAAGVAAMLSVLNRTTPDCLDVKELQTAMVNRSIPLHLPDVGLCYRESNL